ncbi:EAL domain-containing protein [Undibacterium jejuense]|uniref:EAL domain-containing protein n=1 Tax=Undibacterium jejuense TaxID=1344949 RepID=A0A923HBW7_9BURK|nr:EAL domain-containing protein [Undibacterium jejuense]MBC3860844.1 EAL domain-containing protein [Undibacterium jejuense]
MATRDFLQQQLSSHAQDTAGSLSHDLATSLSRNDLVLAEVQLSSVFDRGYYQKIILFDVYGKKLVSKELPLKVDNVPLPFSSLLQLQTPPGEAFISEGWRQLGKIVVINQPTFAYQFLWDSFKQQAGLMLLMYSLVFFLTMWLLKIILRPLSLIEHTALDIQNKRFNQILELPNSREFRRVVSAMNSMSSKISEMLSAETSKAEAFRAEAYTDKVTGLDNRKAFDLRLNALLQEDGGFSSGYLIVLEFDGLKEFNHEHGYQEGDQLLADVIKIALSCSELQIGISGRIGGTAFGFVGFDVLSNVIDSEFKALQRKLIGFIEHFSAKNLSFNLGCVHFSAGQTRGELFAKVDLALETARQNGRNVAINFNLADENKIAEGSSGWRALIQSALSEKRWALFTQPVFNLTAQDVFQHEIFSRLIDQQGNFISAALFLPMAMRHQLMTDIDKAVISLVIDQMNSLGYMEANVAVNVSAQSIESESFREWLGEKLVSSQDAGSRLSFELSEFGCGKNMPSTMSFIALLRSYGVLVGFDHFGLAPGSLDLLRKVVPDYIKLDSGLVDAALESEQAQLHLRSVILLANALDVKVIAQNVESAKIKDWLINERIIFGQGYFLSPLARM